VDLPVIYPNPGFTGVNNCVILPALESDDPPEYVMLLNADTLVKEHALDAPVECMDHHPKAGIAAGFTHQLKWFGCFGRTWPVSPGKSGWIEIGPFLYLRFSGLPYLEPRDVRAMPATVDTIPSPPTRDPALVFDQK
jgi:hypothetical protein